MKDSIERQIKLEEIEYDVVWLMVDCLHFGRLEIPSCVVAKKLLVAADRFMMDKLKVPYKTIYST